MQYSLEAELSEGDEAWFFEEEDIEVVVASHYSCTIEAAKKRLAFSSWVSPPLPLPKLNSRTHWMTKHSVSRYSLQPQLPPEFQPYDPVFMESVERFTAW